MSEIVAPFYPIIYVRGYAMTQSEKEGTFNDAYYGFAATSVEKRQGTPERGNYLKADIFEGQLIRLMKNHGYIDSYNNNLAKHEFPSRGIWICRFYDEDYLSEKPRYITDHAKELSDLIVNIIPGDLEKCNVDLGINRKNYKVILVAHSMGGLVCRTVIQNLLPDSKKFIHRFITMGTPHKGIELGLVPDSLEQWLAKNLNPYGSKIFLDKDMRDYLKLMPDEELNSLGNSGFPVKRCLCLIGSDHKSYGAAKFLTGSHSDGLVKQSHAYIVAGKKPPNDGSYDEDNVAYYANVHRAHSGFRGIVNSYESYENIQRFLFGNVKAQIWLDGLNLITPSEKGDKYFYDLEFQLSIRGTNSFLHVRKQDPCENAMRFNDTLPGKILLHTVFLNSDFIKEDEKYMHFLITLKLVEYRVKDGWLWDKEYPGRTIYSESLEIRVIAPGKEGHALQFRWLSDTIGNEWKNAERNNGNQELFFPLRDGARLKGNITIQYSAWPDKETEG